MILSDMNDRQRSGELMLPPHVFLDDWLSGDVEDADLLTKCTETVLV